MKPKKRQKLCFNCDGEVDLDVIVCPYCAADLREEKPEQPITQNVRPLNEAHMSESLYPSNEPEACAPVKEAVAEKSDMSDSQSPNRSVGSILLLTLGSQLFILGFLLVLLAHKGSVTLKWDARLWFLYIFASIPFLIFGYRSLSK